MLLAKILFGISWRHYHHYYTPCKFLTLALTGGLLQEFEWQQVFRTLLSILTDLKQCKGLDDLDSSFDFQSLRSFFQAIDITVTLMFHYFFNSLTRSKCLSFPLLFFWLCDPPGVFWLCYGQSDRLRNRCKRVRTLVVLFRSLSDKYPWERYEPPYPPSYGLNRTTTVLLGEWLWH